MTSCPACKSPNLDARSFCGACGASIARFCGSCGFKNLLPDLFCGGCGTPLTHGAQERPVHPQVQPTLFAAPPTSEAAPSNLPLGAEDELLAIACESAAAPVEPEDTKVSQDDIDSLFGV